MSKKRVNIFRKKRFYKKKEKQLTKEKIKIPRLE